MSRHVCGYVHIVVCGYVYVCIYVCVYVHVCMYVYMYANVHACMYMHIYILTYYLHVIFSYTHVLVGEHPIHNIISLYICQSRVHVPVTSFCSKQMMVHNRDCMDILKFI